MGGSLTRWMAATAAVIGSAHEKTGTPCQDVACSHVGDGLAAVVLADGAGSAARSELGAHLATQATLRLLKQEFENLVTAPIDEVRHQVVDAVLNSLATIAGSDHWPLRDLACTLLFAAVRNGTYIAGHLGDGIIACARNDAPAVLSEPQRGEHANETVFVTSSVARSAMYLERGPVENISAFALMSDGTAESFYQRRARRVAPAVASIWSWLDANTPQTVERALSENLREVVRTATGDDCSFAVLRRVNVQSEDLHKMSDAFLRQFLECPTARGLKSPLAVIDALASTSDASGRSNARIAAATGFSASSVYRHMRFLRNIFRPSEAAVLVG